ncbi:GNAT family N-acetyltransferase [Pseudonocardia parietis]|uniref:GNAT superfamily N-acetyltransferase n=1 Tax=Pseudonocardia parietis TaxID=570936 RepID=A0ABS4VRT9_9PSEU|nr:GNAT family N-acetyltransferase [Pseudonocardia parietis]MBP2366631.1 GNAT superfamily N-acetyltransferase [Pseudonocardia parietis]
MTTGAPAARRVVDPHPGAAAALGDLWVAVTEAGGAVDFVPGWDPGEIRDLAAAMIDDVRSGAARMLVVGDETAPEGTVFLVRESGIAAHRADVARLMVRPGLQGRGLGTVLLEAAVAQGREMGVEMLTLGARGGTPLPAFYAARGFVEYGRLPGGVRLSEEDTRDVHLFVRSL